MFRPGRSVALVTGAVIVSRGGNGNRGSIINQQMAAQAGLSVIYFAFDDNPDEPKRGVRQIDILY